MLAFFGAVHALLEPRPAKSALRISLTSFLLSGPCDLEHEYLLNVWLLLDLVADTDWLLCVAEIFWI